MAPSAREGEKVETLPNEARADNLGAQYSQAADDSMEPEKKREAAMLYSVAEAHLNDEAPDEVLATITDAIKLFEQIGDSNGLADSLRLQMRGYRALAEKEREKGRGGKEEKILMEAEGIMRMELSKFRAAMDKRGEAAMLLAVAEALVGLGGSPRKAEALDYLLDAQDIARELGDTKLEADIVYERCMLLHKRHRYKLACQAAREAQKLFHSVRDDKNEGYAWFSLGVSQISNGRVEDGFVSMRKALSIYRRIGNKKLEATTLQSFAEWYINEREEFALGVKAAMEAETIFKELGDQAKAIGARKYAVEGTSRMKDFVKALALAKEGLEMAREVGRPEEIFRSIQLIATVHMDSRNMAQAHDCADELVQMSMDMEDKRWRAHALLVVANICDAEGTYDRGAYDRAEELGMEVINILQDCPRFEEELFHVIQFLGRVRIKKDEYEEALECMILGRKVAQRAEDTYLEAAAMLGTSGAHYGLDDLEQAKKAGKLARELFQEEGCQRGEARVLKLALSDYYMEEQDFVEARKLTQEGVRLMEDVGDNKMCCQMRHRLAEIYLEENKPAEAAKAAMEALKLARMEEDKRSIACVLFTVLSSNYMLLVEVPESDRGSKAYRQSLDKMSRYAKEGLGLSVKCKDTELEAVANLWVGKMNLMQGKDKEAAIAAENSIELAKEIKESSLEIDATIVLAMAQDSYGETKQAVELLKQAMQKSFEIDYQQGEVQASQLLEQILGQEGAENGSYSANLMRPEESGVASQAASSQAFRAPDLGRVRWFITEKLREMNGTTEAIDADVPVLETGIDSLTSVELRTQLQQEFRVNLPSTVMHNYPTTSEIARLIVNECRSKRLEWRS